MTLPIGTRVRYRGYGPNRGATGSVILSTGWKSPRYSFVRIDATGSKVHWADNLCIVLTADPGPSPRADRQTGNRTGH